MDSLLWDQIKSILELFCPQLQGSKKQQLIQNASRARTRRVPDELSLILSFQMPSHLLLLSFPGKGLCSKECTGSPRMMDLCVWNAHSAQTPHKTIKPPYPRGAGSPKNPISAVEMLADFFSLCLALRMDFSGENSLDFWRMENWSGFVEG